MFGRLASNRLHDQHPYLGFPGARLEADHPEKGLLFACRYGRVPCRIVEGKPHEPSSGRIEGRPLRRASRGYGSARAARCTQARGSPSVDGSPVAWPPAICMKTAALDPQMRPHPS